MVKGSHIVVRKLYDGEQCYIFQNADQRIFFVIPYEREFSLIGTTDLDYSGDPADASASSEEIAYLCRGATEYLKVPVTPDQVVWTYSGVRPLYDDGASKAQQATRDYTLDLDAPSGTAALLSIFGGKITTYRRLAEAAIARLEPHLPRSDRVGGGMDRVGATAGWGFPGRGFRGGVGQVSGAISVYRSGDATSADPGIWDAGGGSGGVGRLHGFVGYCVRGRT